MYMAHYIEIIGIFISLCSALTLTFEAEILFSTILFSKQIIEGKQIEVSNSFKFMK